MINLLKFCFLLILILFLTSINLLHFASSLKYISLDGNQWSAINQNKTINISSIVPGNIYTDLSRNGILKQDLFYGKNDVNYRWVSYDNWTYSRTFQINDEALLSHPEINLICHGVDTVSRVFINNHYIGDTNNMFVRYQFPIKSDRRSLNLLRKGTNEIKFEFESAVTYAKRKFDQTVKVKYPIPPVCLPPAQKGECHGNFIRKMPASFAWDWGPAFPTQGIWKSIGLEFLANNSVVIQEMFAQTIWNQSNSTWSLNVTLLAHQPVAHDVQLNIHLNEHKLYEKEIKLKSDNQMINLIIPINKTSISIAKWWPNQVAEGKQSLYNLKVTLGSTNSNEVSEKKIKIGFRTIEIVQDPVKPVGLTFYFKVNGLPFFAKGANLIPTGMFNEQISINDLRKLLKSVKDANMNMIRMWGGGIYQSDEFYQMADEMGILIWQDFMFAELYPTDDEFLGSVSMEVSQQVKRIMHHACIALWSGNNEMEGVIASAYWPEVKSHPKEFRKDYIRLYIETIKSILDYYDPTRPFVPSSSSNGLETIKQGWISNDVNDRRFGDFHYYYFGNDQWDWTKYPIGRFASEFGVQSYPSFHAFVNVTQPSDWTYPINSMIDHRQHLAGGTNFMNAAISDYMKLPAAGGEERFKDMIYLSQIAQAMTIKISTESYRRNREIDAKTGLGMSMGALYWQLNDVWQGPTWSSLEWGGKWKMLHYYARRMFTNIIATPYIQSENQADQFKISLVRDDYLGDHKFNLTVKIFKWSSLKPQLSLQIKTESSKNFSSQVVYSRRVDDLLAAASCASKKECVIQVILENKEMNLLSDNFLLIGKPKEAIGIQKPNLKVTEITRRSNYIGETNNVYEIRLTTDNLAAFVWLDFKIHSGIKGTFNDNGFFMFEASRVIEFHSETSVSIEDLKNKLEIRSFTDVVTD